MMKSLSLSSWGSGLVASPQPSSTTTTTKKTSYAVFVVHNNYCKKSCPKLATAAAVHSLGTATYGFTPDHPNRDRDGFVSFNGTRKRKIADSFRCSSALTPELKTTLDKFVTSHKVVLFMKGTKDFPQCGFSNTVVQILKSSNVAFETFNILENDMLRQALKEYSNWPTFPQLYIDGEFFGGCDITLEAYQNGQLQEVLEKAMCS